MWVQGRERALVDVPLPCPGQLLGSLLLLGMLLLLLLPNSCASKTMLLLLLLFPQLLRWEQQSQRASMKEAMASKAPGPRRLKQDAVVLLDDIPPVMLEDVVPGCLHILYADVLLELSWMTMSKDEAKDDLRVREDRIAEDACSMNRALMKPSKML